MLFNKVQELNHGQLDIQTRSGKRKLNNRSYIIKSIIKPAAAQKSPGLNRLNQRKLFFSFNLTSGDASLIRFYYDNNIHYTDSKINQIEMISFAQ